MGVEKKEIGKGRDKLRMDGRMAKMRRLGVLDIRVGEMIILRVVSEFTHLLF